MPVGNNAGAIIEDAELTEKNYSLGYHLFKVICLGSVTHPALAGHCHPRMFLAGILRQIARYSFKKFPLKALGNDAGGL